MRPATSSLAALGIALVSGLTGYQIGRTGAPPPAPASGGVSTPSAATRRPGVTATTGFRKTDIPAFRAELSREPDALRRFSAAMVHMEDWVAADPADALAWLLEQPRSGRREEVLRLALTQFSERDPKGAAEWAKENLTGVELNNALILLVEDWAARDGAEAADWLRQQPATEERNAAMEGTLFIWASNDPKAAASFLAQHPGEGELASVLRYATFAGWAKADPENAVRASLESSRRHEDPDQFANTLANWGTIDLPASSDWLLANLPDGPERAAALTELARLYADQSPETGVEWLEKLRPGAERSSAANAFVSDWARSDAAAAAAWAAGNPSVSLTRETITEIVHGFALKNETGFDAWRSALPAGPLKETADELAESGGGEDEDSQPRDR